MTAPPWLARALVFDRSGLQRPVGARPAAGIVVPLLVGAAVGHAVEGAQASADAAARGDPESLWTRRLALLAAYLDPLVDSVNTLAELVETGRLLPTGTPPAPRQRSTAP